MNMIKFDFQSFLFDKKMSIAELGNQMKIDYSSIFKMARRGTVKPAFIRELESKFGDLSKYIEAPVKEKVA